MILEGDLEEGAAGFGRGIVDEEADLPIAERAAHRLDEIGITGIGPDAERLDAMARAQPRGDGVQRVCRRATSATWRPRAATFSAKAAPSPFRCADDQRPGAVSARKSAIAILRAPTTIRLGAEWGERGQAVRKGRKRAILHRRVEVPSLPVRAYPPIGCRRAQIGR